MHKFQKIAQEINLGEHESNDDCLNTAVTITVHEGKPIDVKLPLEAGL